MNYEKIVEEIEGEIKCPSCGNIALVHIMPDYEDLTFLCQDCGAISTFDEHKNEIED